MYTPSIPFFVSAPFDRNASHNFYINQIHILAITCLFLMSQ